MLNTDAAGSYFVRIKDLPIAQEVVGKIVYVNDVSHDGIVLQFTDDCRPLEEKYTLPPQANDNGWYDVTELVLAANSVILPKFNRCKWDSETAVNYRNFVEVQVQPLSEADAVGRLCLLGDIKGQNVTYSRQAYYVAAADSNGYILTYAGFCKPLESWQNPDIKQRVLRLASSTRKLFPAEQIVKACNEACAEDMAVAMDFVSNLLEAASIASTDTSVGETVFTSGLRRMHLE